MNVIHVQADDFDQLGKKINQVLDDSPTMDKRLVDIKYFTVMWRNDSGCISNMYCASIIFRKTS